jgi:hypothetical protein
LELTGVLPGKTRLYLMTKPQTSDGSGLGVAGSITVDVPANGLEGVLLPFYSRDITVKGRVVQGNGAAAALATRITFHAGELLPIPEGFDTTTDGNGVFQIQLMRRKYSVLCRDLRTLLLDGNSVTGTMLDFVRTYRAHARGAYVKCARDRQGPCGAPILRTLFVYGQPHPLDHESGPERRLCAGTASR